MTKIHSCDVYILANPKGGVGKSAAANAIAYSHTFADRYSKIAIVELDHQGTQRIWMQRRQAADLPVSKVILETMYDEDLDVLGEKLKRLTSHFDCLILDLPGESQARIVTKLAVALTRLLKGLMLIPMSDSSADEDAFKENFLPFLEPHLETNKYWILPSRFHWRTNPKNAVAYFASILPDGPSAISAVMPLYNVFGAYGAEGQTLQEYAEMLAPREAAQAKRACQYVEVVASAVINKI